MRDNLKLFLERFIPSLDLQEPVLEIGSLQVEDQETYADIRPFFGDRTYLGCDMRPGLGVECLTDAHRLPFRDESAGAVLLLDTLEHVLSPFLATEEAIRVLRPGGVVIIASVMNFPIHSYPSDFWRFTPAAFDYLLEPLPNRHILVQGDAEHPHTVIGVGIRTPLDGAADALRGAVQEIQTTWPETASGGPLFAWTHSEIVVSQRSDDRLLPELERGHDVTQTFVCPANGLTRIDVRLSNLGRMNLSHVVFGLQDATSGEELASHRLNAAHVVGESWVSVPLPYQRDSAGRLYALRIASPDAGPEQGISAFGSSETCYADGQLSIDGADVEGSLCFQVHCTPDAEGAPMPRLETRMRSPNAVEPTEKELGELAAILRLEDRGWEQTRHLAAVVEASFDSLRADIKSLRDRLHTLEEKQDKAVEQSTEAAAITRSLKNNPIYRLWRPKKD